MFILIILLFINLIYKQEKYDFWKLKRKEKCDDHILEPIQGLHDQA